MTRFPGLAFVVVAIAVASAIPAGAQGRMDLAALQDSAAAAQPRARQLDILARQSALRRRTLAGELLPAVSIEGSGQYQSDVPRLPSAPPGASEPPHDTYDARVGLTQRIFDPTLRPRTALERAQLEQSQAGVRTAMYALRQQVNDAFFAALRAQSQADELGIFITAIESQARLAAARVREGAALGSEELTVRVELLRRRQALAELRIHQWYALAVLADLTGVAIDTGSVLREPDLSDEMRAARELLAAGRAGGRPEFAQFERSRELLRQQERARGAQDLPRVSAFGRAGYGRPGLNPLNTTFDSYWLAGVQLQWAPWTWGATRRDREVLAAQREIVATEETAFTDAVRRSATQQLAAVEQLESTLATDEELIALRGRIAEESAARLAESVITPTEHVERESELLAARIARVLHRVELAQARARLITTLGIEVR
jgi:outer membrane protein TolC